MAETNFDHYNVLREWGNIFYDTWIETRGSGTVDPEIGKWPLELYHSNLINIGWKKA